MAPRAAAETEYIVPPTARAIANPQENAVPTFFQPAGVNKPVPLVEFIPYPQPVTDRKSPVVKILIGGVVVVLLLGLVSAGAFILFAWEKANAEALPDHLGMFAQSPDKSRVDELAKLDISNAVDGKDNLLRDEALPVLDANPTLILYSDGKDIAVSDLRLVQLDTIKADGTFDQIDFQASPVESKPEMKRLRVPSGLASGKYAFALIDGFLNDGKHKFWAFQIRNTAKPDNNGGSLHSVTIPIKPTPTPTPAVKTPTPTPSMPPPSGGVVAYTTTSNLVLRTGPSQDAGKIRNLKRGEKVYVLRLSENTEVFNGIESRFAFIQTENGQTGWVFAAFLR